MSGRPRVVVRRGGVTLPTIRRTKRVTSSSRCSIRAATQEAVTLTARIISAAVLAAPNACGSPRQSTALIGRRSSTCARATARRRGRPRRRWSIASPRRRRSPSYAPSSAACSRAHNAIRSRFLGPGTTDPRAVKPDLKRGQSFKVGSSLPYYKRTSGAAVAQQKHDPTRSKPLVVLTWLRINIERMVSAGALETTQLSRLTEQIEGLVAAGGAIDKIDRMVLPLPYCQLLKIFQIFFVFTLPFVLAPQLGLWTPIVAAFTAIGFFGLDQVGVELEGPFGVDDNDFPLLTMGLAMCNDLDAMVRTVSRTRMEARLTSFASTESHQIQGAAAPPSGGPSR